MKKKSESIHPRIIQDASLERMRDLLPERDFKELLSELARPLRPAFRINSLKMDPMEVPALAERNGWQIEQIPFCPTGFQILSGSKQLSNTLEFRMGQLYIQDAASMFPVELFDIAQDPHPLILDMAASPGGKTTHLISRTGDTGLVIANDSSANRLQALKLNLQNCGAIRQAVTCLPGEQFGFRFPNTFDLVLLDAPCSMEGLRATESHHLKPTTERERWQLSHRQQNLLTSAILAAKPGSQIVYSTCTLAPEEDELVLQAILDEFSGKVSIVHPALPTDINAPAMSVFGDVQFSPEMKQAFRLWPHQFHTAGFFAALLKKTKPFPETSTSHYPSPIPERNWNIVNTKDGSKINELLNALYGFYLDELLTEQQCGLWEHHGMIILVPNGIFEILKGITPLATGLPLGHLIPDGFLPSHEFVSRFHPKFIRGKHILPDRLRAAWMRGEDLRDVLLPFPLRSVVVMIDENGRYLGCCKVLADRAKNLLPKRVVL